MSVTPSGLSERFPIRRLPRYLRPVLLDMDFKIVTWG